MTEQELAKILRKRRLELGLTQKELAKMTGFRRSAIERIEAAKFFPRMNVLQRILDVLELKLEITPKEKAPR